MPLELLTRGSDRMNFRGQGLCSIGVAVAELMAGYDFLLDNQADEDDSAAEAELALAACD